MKGNAEMSILKKRIVNTAMLDLRSYTPQALSKIRIINAATIILPESPSDEFMSTLSGITINCAATFNLPDDKHISILNGIDEITSYTDNVISSNGIAIVHALENEKPLDIITNGIFIYSPSTNINFISNNGMSVAAPFETNSVKAFPSTITLNAQFFEAIEDYTIIVAGSRLVLDSSVTTDILKAKKIHLVAGSKIECAQSVIGYVQTISTVGSSIKAYE